MNAKSQLIVYFWSQLNLRKIKLILLIILLKLVKYSLTGGQGGIRTHGTRERTAVFKTAALDHSATCP